MTAVRAGQPLYVVAALRGAAARAAAVVTTRATAVVATAVAAPRVALGGPPSFRHPRRCRRVCCGRRAARARPSRAGALVVAGAVAVDDALGMAHVDAIVVKRMQPLSFAAATTTTTATIPATARPLWARSFWRYIRVFH